MACLGSVTYDPGSATNQSTASLLAMTALDTTNLRITFTAPANGTVLVRLRCITRGSGSTPMILLGVLDGATVKGRGSPMTNKVGSSGTLQQPRESLFVVTGLTPSQSYTWDAAYAVQVVQASSNISYGGPNDTTTNNAYGAFVFEVWETAGLLAGKLYDPGTAATHSLASALAMTAFDTTNLRLTFNAPASGRVLVRMRTLWTGATGTNPQAMFGVLDGATVKGRMPATGAGNIGAAVSTDHNPLDVSFCVSGLTPSSSYTWDAAYGVENVLAASVISYGGPNNSSGANAWGGFAYEIWSA